MTAQFSRYRNGGRTRGKLASQAGRSGLLGSMRHSAAQQANSIAWPVSPLSGSSHSASRPQDCLRSSSPTLQGHP